MATDAPNDDFINKVEELCARCDSLHRQIARLQAENKKLNARNQSAKKALNDLLIRLHDYTE